MLDINVAQIFIALLVLLFALTVHESAHAWVADRLGDPTGRRLGRVSLNPVVHADPVGTVLFPLIAILTRLPVIGWARPVPVDVLRLRSPRRDYLLIALAGPVSNLGLAVVSAVVLRFVTVVPSGAGAAGLAVPLARVAVQSLEINLLLAIFNLVPVPPLDGSSVLAGLLPAHLADRFDTLRPYGFVLLYALMFTGALSYVMAPPYRLLLSWLL